MTLALWETGFRPPDWILESKDKKVLQGREMPWLPVSAQEVTYLFWSLILLPFYSFSSFHLFSQWKSCFAFRVKTDT